MDIVVVFFFYGSILFFLVASAIKITGFVTTPLHLKWEYYKGSSVYESLEWWTKSPPRLSDKVRAILLDILFLREYYRRNKKYWLFLYLFHLGIYLLILWHLWLFAAALLLEAETASSAGLISGHVFAALTTAGALGIFILRISDTELSLSYPPVHYIKWLFIIFTLGAGFYAVHIYFNGSMSAILDYVNTQLTFGDLSRKLHPPPATATHVIFGSLWLIYLPFSHILRLFFRYYHVLRFDDVPNVKGGVIERQVKELLCKPVSWSAPHIQTGKSWAEVTKQLPEDGEKGSDEGKKA